MATPRLETVVVDVLMALRPYRRRKLIGKGSERFIERPHEQLAVVVVDDQRRLDLDDVAAWPVRGEQDARVARVLDHRGGLGRAGQLDAEEEALAADVGDGLVALGQP